MLETPQRSTKRKRLPTKPAELRADGDPDQALLALEAYATQAEEALGEALSQAAEKDLRIAALEQELKSQQRLSQPQPSPERPKASVELPNLSPPLHRRAQQTRQALEAVEHHTSEAGRSLAELLAGMEEREQCLQELELQLNEARQELQDQEQRSRAAALEAAGSRDRQIEELRQQLQVVEQHLEETRRELSGRDSRIQDLETELESVRAAGHAAREASADADQQLHQLHDVLEHYVLRCRDLERRSHPESTLRSAPSEVRPLSPLGQRLKAEIDRWEKSEPRTGRVCFGGDGSPS